MSNLCIDTSAYSHFKAGDSQAAKLISQSRNVGIPAIVLGELRAGFLMGNRAAKNEQELNMFISNPVVKVMDVDEEASRIYAELVVELKAAGTPIPTNDIWIAALSLRDGASILTFDKHFELIKRVGVYLLKVN
ncbi:MAG: type II toxin-antitoxin system VapC family toxin [Cyanobacteria bacterium TGS_CYA1]|nr:type II toxin-antitoxin system VapC family toxin [Cyanobacteria bacterium TGS_CYA1]